MPFHTGVSLRLHAPPEQWREVIYLLAGVTIWARHTWETLTLGRARKHGLKERPLLEHQGVSGSILHGSGAILWPACQKNWGGELS